MAVLEVHACCPPKNVYGLPDLSDDRERRGENDDISQIKLTKYQTMHQNANIGGTCMLPTKVCVWPSRFDRQRRGGRECNAKTKIFSLFMDWIGGLDW